MSLSLARPTPSPPPPTLAPLIYSLTLLSTHFSTLPLHAIMPTMSNEPKTAASLDPPALRLLAAAAVHEDSNDDPREPHETDQQKVAAPAPKVAPAPPMPPPPPNRMRAEQLRREALEESLTDYLPIENLRAVEKMSNQELKESKDLVMCFLSGRANQLDDEAMDKVAKFKNKTSMTERDLRFVNEYQNDQKNLTTAYHYTYDPSLPLPKSLPDRTPAPIPPEKKRTVDKHQREKKKRQKTKSVKNPAEDLLTKIDAHPLLLGLPQRTESHDTEEEGGASGPAPLISNVPAVVSVKPDISSEHQEMDESVHSSVVVDEASVLTTNPTTYFFEWDQTKKGWSCKRCRNVHPSFQAANSFIAGSSDPNPKLMHTHKNSCLGMKADLTKAIHAVLNLTKTSSFKFKHITSAEFQSVVRITANGNEEYVTLFTTDLRNRWLDPIKYKVPSASIDWKQYPIKVPIAEPRENLVASLVSLAKTMGLGFDFVVNKYFLELFQLISPNCCMPTPEDLMLCW